MKTREDPILDVSAAPTEPIERLMWLGGVMDKVKSELDRELAAAYFQARFQGQLDVALSLGLHSRKKVMAYTRRANEATGRMVRWGDGRA